MADAFEARLERLFAEPPAFSDAQAFAARTEARLGRGRRLRGVMIVGAGLAGGLVAVAQLLNSNLEALARPVGSPSAGAVQAALADGMADRRLSGLFDQAAGWMPTASGGMEVVWTAAALAAAGLALLTARVVGER